MAPEFMCKDVVIEARAISSTTPGPMGLKFFGNSKGSKDSLGYDGRRPKNSKKYKNLILFIKSFNFGKKCI